MTIVSVALYALLALVGSGADQQSGISEAKKSVALVTGLFNQRATGFIVGWQSPILFIVTARHVVYEDHAEGPAVVAKKVPILLDAGVCGEPLEATVYNGDSDCDCAILTAPALDCAAGLNKLRSLRRTSLNASGAPPNTALVALVNDSNEGIARKELNLASWKSDRITFQRGTEQGWSGAPVLTPSGEIVGMLQSTGSLSGYATDFAVVMSKWTSVGVPFNRAGRFSEIELRGYPSGSRVTITGDATGVVDLGESPQTISLSPGKMHLTVTATGYASADDQLTISDEGFASRCIRLVTPLDRAVAKSVLPLMGLTAGLAIATGVSAKVSADAKDDFQMMPTRAAFDDSNSKVAWTRGLLIGTTAVAAITSVAFGLNHFSLSPRLSSTMKDCPR